MKTTADALAEQMRAAGRQTLGEYAALRAAQMTGTERAAAKARQDAFDEACRYCESCGILVEDHPDGREALDNACPLCDLCIGTCCRCADEDLRAAGVDLWEAA